MANLKISQFVAGGTALSTDRIAAARTPFAANTDDVYLLPGAIAARGLNDSYHTVVGYGATDTANGTELVAAYAAAKLLTPGGNALSATNRHTILILPGRYQVTDGALVLDTQFIDLIGVSINSGACVFSSGFTDYGDTVILSNGHTLGQTVNDVTIANLCLLTSSATKYAYNINSATTPQTKLINVLVTNSSNIQNPCMNLNQIAWSGYYQDVRAWNESSFGNVVSASLDGNFVRCKAGSFAFGTGTGSTVSGKFTDCEADGASFGGSGTASGTFLRCRFVSIEGTVSPMFGGSGTASGTFEECEGNGVDGCFGNVSSGTFKACRSNTGSSPTAGGAFGSGATAVASGKYYECEGGANSFGSNGATGKAFSGEAYNCRAGINSFGGGGTNAGTMSGLMYNCVLSGRLNATVTGRIERTNITATGTNETALLVATGAKIYFCTLVGTGSGFSVTAASAANVVIASCDMNLGQGPNVTNLVTTPYIVNDTDVA